MEKFDLQKFTRYYKDPKEDDLEGLLDKLKSIPKDERIEYLLAVIAIEIDYNTETIRRGL